MKTSKWFTCLSYSEGTDILIPQTETFEISYFSSSPSKVYGEIRDFDFDSRIKDLFKISVPEKKITRILAQVDDKNSSKKKLFLLTGLVPQLVKLNLEELKTFSGELGSIFLKRGIAACRFADGRIQYALDITDFIGVILKDD